MIKYILAWKLVKHILDTAEAKDWNNGKAYFFLNEELLKALFPKEYAEAKERAENEVE